MTPGPADAIWIGTLASLAAGLATGVGALPVFFVRAVSASANALMLGLGAGVMLGATSFALLLPAIEAAAERGFGPAGSVAVAGAGVLLGAFVLGLAHRTLPHEHLVTGPEGIGTERLRRMSLFVIAVTIHNVPEGLAVGVGFGGGDYGLGASLAIGIGLQNMPEGLVVALALAAVGYPPGRAFLVALLTGLVEPLGGLLGVSAVTFSQGLLPWGLSFAAGAMLFVVSGEIIPESHSMGRNLWATAGIVVGFVVMMGIDVAIH